MNAPPPIPDPRAPAPTGAAETAARMKPKELLLTGLVYWIVVTVAYFVVLRFDADSAFDLSHALGAIAATSAAAWLYQSRHDVLAPASVKTSAGLTLAALSIVQGLIYQPLLKWTPLELSPIIAAVGSFIFPFIIWNNTGKAAIQSRKPRHPKPRKS